MTWIGITKAAALTATLMALVEYHQTHAIAHEDLQCSDAHQLLTALDINNDRGSLKSKIVECISPLLFLNNRWVDASDTTAYCGTDACLTVVKKLRDLPACTWEHIPSGNSDAEMARRIFQDCANGSE